MTVAELIEKLKDYDDFQVVKVFGYDASEEYYLDMDIDCIYEEQDFVRIDIT